MDSYLKISITDTGIKSECRLSKVSGLDRVLLLNAFASLLDMDDSDLRKALLVLPLANDGQPVDKEASSNE